MVLVGKLGADETELLESFCSQAKDMKTLSAEAAKAEDTASARADAAHAGEEYRSDSEIYGDDDDDGGGFDLKAFEAEELRKKQAAANKKAKDPGGARRQKRRARAEIAKSGKRAAGGMHKFDPDEVDVHGGDATADDFLDAFGFGDDVSDAASDGDISYADELKKHLTGALNDVLAKQPSDPFRAMQQTLFQASLSGADALTAVTQVTPEVKAYEAKYGLYVSVDDVLFKMKKRLVVGPKDGFKFLLSDAGDLYTELSKRLKAMGGDLGLGMTAEELAEKDRQAAKAKREKEAKAEAERTLRMLRTRRVLRRSRRLARRPRAACTSLTRLRSMCTVATRPPTTSSMRLASEAVRRWVKVAVTARPACTLCVRCEAPCRGCIVVALFRVSRAASQEKMVLASLACDLRGLGG